MKLYLVMHEKEFLDFDRAFSTSIFQHKTIHSIPPVDYLKEELSDLLAPTQDLNLFLQLSLGTKFICVSRVIKQMACRTQEAANNFNW